MKIEYVIPIVGYLLGSIPFGYLLVKTTRGTDIRKEGSGNIGATNVFRKNRWAGVLTLLLDAGKGYLAVWVAGWMGGSREWMAVAGVCAIAGHVFTCFLGFKGGKGVATGCGAYLAILPHAVGSTLLVFGLTVLLTRYISLASVLATAAFPLLAFWLGAPPRIIFWAAVGSLLIIVKHHQNLRRLLNGTEQKFVFGSRS